MEKLLTVIAVLLLFLVAWLSFLNGTHCVGEALAEPAPEKRVDVAHADAADVERAITWIVTERWPNRHNPAARHPAYRAGLADSIARHAETNVLPWSLVTAIVYRESSFDPNARGDVDASGNARSHGLMQVGVGVRAKCAARGYGLDTKEGQIACGTWWLREATDTICGGKLRDGFAFYASGRTCHPDTAHLRSVVADRFGLAKRLRRAAEGAL